VGLPIPVPGGGLLPGANLLRLGRVFASIIHYNRLGKRAEARNGGVLAPAELAGLLTAWARNALRLLNVEVTRAGVPPSLEIPALFVGNHVSYLDIPLLLSEAPVAFLGKAEIARWPILGSAGRRAGMIFVQRESTGSRSRAALAIPEALRTRGMGLALFPAGTTSLDEGRPWSTGAFKIARAAQVPVQPFRLSYDPPEVAAFVGDDLLLPHLFRLLRAGRIQARIEFGAPRMVEEPRAMAQELWRWSRGEGAP
jgi:1-acyl-sn-glycerol-3-phosphate acyltransferase